MLECSMFGYLREIDGLCNYLRLYRRTERITNETLYTNGSRTLVVCEGADGIYLVNRDMPDRNKNRTALCSRIQRHRIKTPDTLGLFLSAFGFEAVRQNRVTAIVFEKEGVGIEISRCSTGETDDIYLVKASVVTESAADGEKLVGKVAEELEEHVQLVKP